MELNKKNMKKIMTLIVFTSVIFWLGFYLPNILNIFLYIISVFVPIILGFSVAFVLNVLLRVIEGYWDKIFKNNVFAAKIKRFSSVFISLVIILIIIFILIFMIVPEISRSIMLIGSQLPSYASTLEQTLKAIFEYMGVEFPNIQDLAINWQGIASNIIKLLNSGTSTFFNTTLNVTTSIFSGIITAFLAFVFAIYMLFSKEKLILNLHSSARAFLKEDSVKSITRVLKLSNVTFTNFVTGQLLEAIIIGSLAYIGMYFMNMPYAIMIASLVSVTSLIPVVGAFFGTFVGAVLIFLISPIQAFWFVIYIIVIQQIDSNLIYPRVVGKSVGLPGIWVLAAITIGASLAGVLGMLVAVPIVSILYVLFKEEVVYRLTTTHGKNKQKIF